MQTGDGEAGVVRVQSNGSSATMTPVSPPMTRMARAPEANSAGTEDTTWPRGLADGRQAHREHVADQAAEAQEARSHRGQRDPGIAEDPERMLPEKRIAAADGIEERPVGETLQLEQKTARDGKASRTIPATTRMSRP